MSKLKRLAIYHSMLRPNEEFSFHPFTGWMRFIKVENDTFFFKNASDTILSLDVSRSLVEVFVYRAH
jgi:hypothetical protein